ncbi:hypothetical protein D9M71_808350 [compost metagenome]
MALAMPWGMLNTPPKVWEIAWTLPSFDWANATPARNEASSICSRACRSEPLKNALGRCVQINLIACRAKAWLIGLACFET